MHCFIRALFILSLALTASSDAMASAVKRKYDFDDSSGSISSSLTRVNRARNPHIRELDLSIEKGLSDIDFIRFFPNLTDLDLSNSDIGDNYEPIGQLIHLERLNLAGICLTTARYITPLVNLTRLKITCPHIGKAVKYIAQLPNLRELDIDGDFRGVEKIGQLTSLESLRLRGVFNNDVYPDVDLGFPTLDFIQTLVNLRKLDLSSNDYIFYIKPIVKLPQLTDLDLAGCKYIRDLSKLKKIKSLVKLNLIGVAYYSGPITEEDLSAIATLPNLRKLKILAGITLPEFPNSVKIKNR